MTMMPLVKLQAVMALLAPEVAVDDSTATANVSHDEEQIHSQEVVLVQPATEKDLIPLPPKQDVSKHPTHQVAPLSSGLELSLQVAPSP